MKAAILFSLAILITPGILIGAEDPDAPKTKRTFKIDSEHATAAYWSIQDGNGILDITLPAVSDDLPMPEPPSTQVWLLQADGSATLASSKPAGLIGISMVGFTTPHLMYVFPPRPSASAVAVVVQVEDQFSVYPLKPHNPPKNQGGADQPAINPESKTQDSA